MSGGLQKYDIAYQICVLPFSWDKMATEMFMTLHLGIVNYSNKLTVIRQGLPHRCHNQYQHGAYKKIPHKSRQIWD